MQYVLVEWDHDLDDEPYRIYSELDDSRCEVRKVEFFRNGICFPTARSGAVRRPWRTCPFRRTCGRSKTRIFRGNPSPPPISPPSCSMRSGTRPRNGPTALWACSFRAASGLPADSGDGGLRKRLPPDTPQGARRRVSPSFTAFTGGTYGKPDVYDDD